MARPSVMSAHDLERLLGQLLMPGTESIRQAEEAMRKALTQPEFIVDLFEQLQHSASAQIRQLAAVLVRRRVGAHWAKLDPQVRQLLQATLVHRLPIEPERPVRRSLTSVVSVVARYALPKGEWPGLFGFLAECSRSATAEHRELSMVLLAALLESPEVVESSLRPHFEVLSHTLLTLLGDQANPAVRRAALKAVGVWAGIVLEDDDAKAMKPLIQPMLDVGAAATAAADDETLTLAFSIFYEVIEASTSVVNAHLPAILEFALLTATSAAMDVETRVAALNLVGASLTYKKKAMVKGRMVSGVAAKLLEACATADADGQIEDDDDDDEISVHRRAAQASATRPSPSPSPARTADARATAVAPPWRRALHPRPTPRGTVLHAAAARRACADGPVRPSQVLHTFAVQLPSKHAVPALLEQIVPAAADARMATRRAALTALAMTAEGCAEAYAQRLDALLPIVYGGCKDAVQVVREAACIAIGQFAQFLQPEIISHYEQVLPHIFLVRLPPHPAPSPRSPPAPSPTAHPTAAVGRPGVWPGRSRHRIDDHSLRTNLLSELGATRPVGETRGLTERCASHRLPDVGPGCAAPDLGRVRAGRARRAGRALPAQSRLCRLPPPTVRCGAPPIAYAGAQRRDRASQGEVVLRARGLLRKPRCAAAPPARAARPRLSDD